MYIFGVFDGHGGPEVAHYVATTLPKEILNEPYFKLKNYPKALVNILKRLDDMLLSEHGEKDLEVISKKLGANFPLNERISHRAGTTGIIILLTKDRIYAANVGDSRAVLSRGHVAVPLSVDHKPETPTERNRI